VCVLLCLLSPTDLVSPTIHSTDPIQIHIYLAKVFFSIVPQTIPDKAPLGKKEEPEATEGERPFR
jgi:hypothetical protein